MDLEVVKTGGEEEEEEDAEACFSEFAGKSGHAEEEIVNGGRCGERKGGLCRDRGGCGRTCGGERAFSPRQRCSGAGIGSHIRHRHQFSQQRSHPRRDLLSSQFSQGELYPCLVLAFSLKLQLSSGSISWISIVNC